MCVYLSVCWFVCLLFIGHTTFVHFAALPPSTPRAAKPSRATQRASGQAHAQREHVRACRTTSQRKNRCADMMPFKNKSVRARACCRIRNCRGFQKKRKRKPTCHFPSSVYSLPSLGVFTFRIVLNRILHKSSLLAPMESRRTCFLSATRDLSTLRRCLRVLREQPSRRGRPRARAGKRMHSESTRVHAVQKIER